MKIFCKNGKVKHNDEIREGFDWTWQESMDMGGWGWCPSLEDVKRMASRMFPDEIIELIFL